jgi:hypothetical protein
MWARCAGPRRTLRPPVGALLVGLLSATVMRNIAANPLLPPAVQSQVDLDSITFVSNDRLKSVLEARPRLLLRSRKRFASTLRRGCAH